MLCLGGLRPNTVILGFYDNSIPEDKLRNRSFFKKRWLKPTTAVNTMATPAFHQQPIVQSGTMEGASTITLNSFSSATTINGNDMYPIFNFSGKTELFEYIFLRNYCLELRQENEEKALDVYSYVQIIKDALHLNKSICLARNFHQLHKDDVELNRRKVFVDIWPVSFLISNKFKHLSQFLRLISSFLKHQHNLM